MEFLKNIIAVVLATIVWLSGVLAIASIWWGIKEQDFWYLYPLGLSVGILIAAFVAAKYSIRFRTALENPLELWGL